MRELKQTYVDQVYDDVVLPYQPDSRIDAVERIYGLPLSMDSLSPLSNIFSDSNILKVFHGADYDIRSLYRDFGFEVNSLFDTHIAAKFIGEKEIGLANLLHKKFKIAIEKKYQKMDWSKRPLPEAMLNYAVLDTCYLLSLKSDFEKEL